MNKRILLLTTGTLLTAIASAQTKIKDGTLTSSPIPNSDAILELESNQKGLLMPRIALSSTDIAAPLGSHNSGMIVYNTATAGTGITAVSPGFYYNDGTKWVRLASSSSITDDQQLGLTSNTLTLEDGGSVDLSPYLDNTDAQQISLSNNILTLTNGGTVDLTQFLDDTDNQQITTFSLNAVSNILTLTLEDGGTQNVDLSTLKIEPWQVQGTTTKATDNSQNIYQMGRVAIGKDSTNRQLDVAGDLRAKYTDGTNYYGIENNNNEFGVPMGLQYVANNADLSSATNVSLLQLRTDIASLSTTNGTGGGAIGAFSSNTGGTVQITAQNAAGNIQSGIVGNSDNTISNLMLSHQKTSAEGTKVIIEKLAGVNFNFIDSNGTTEGSYTFPRNNGTANMVLTSPGGAGNVQLAWQNISTLAPEPFNVSATTTKATTNTQNIYQNGNLGLGDFSATTPLTRLDVRGSVRVGGDAFTLIIPNVGGYPIPATPNTGVIGANSAAFGAGNEASGSASFASGLSSKASGEISFATGSGSQATGSNSTAMGSEAIASGPQSFALGSLVTTSSINETAFGINNAIKTSGLGATPPYWAATDALFQVGNGNQTGPSLPNNALTILKNGYTGIGLAGSEAAAKPTERLDIGNSVGSVGTGLGGVRIRAINSAAYTGNIATDKVVVADANGVLKTVESSTITTEPFQVESTTTKATTNTQNIYQNGNLGLGNFSGSNPVAKLDVRGAVRGGLPATYTTPAYSTAIGVNSAAFGNNNVASGENSMALGSGSSAVGESSVALGGSNNALSNNSTVMGYYNQSAVNFETVAGFFNAFYNLAYMPGVTANSSNGPIFQIGNGMVVNRTNAFTVFKNGNAVVGTHANLPTATTFEVAGSIGARIRSVNSSQTTLTSDHTLICSGAITITLEAPAASNKGRLLYIKDRFGSATIAGHIDGVSGSNGVTGAQSMLFQSDGTTWWQLQ